MSNSFLWLLVIICAFMYLDDAFIQSKLQYIIISLLVCMLPGNVHQL